MPWICQPIFVLSTDPRLVQRVLRAGPDTTCVAPVEGWAALWEATATAAPGSLAVVDPRFGRADGTLSPELRRLCAMYPCLRVLAVIASSPDSYADALTLGAWGVADVLRAGTDDRGSTLRARLSDGYSTYMLEISRIVNNLGGCAQRLDVMMRLHMAAMRVQPKDWAWLFSISEKALRSSLRRKGLPSPERQLAWARVMLAGYLWQSPGHTVESVAAAFGYPGAGPLRRVVRRLTGLTAPELAARPDPLRAAVSRYLSDAMGWGPVAEGW